MLQRRVDLLNDMTGAPREPYIRDAETDQLVANVGTYSIDYSYGQPRLQRMSNERGGVESIGPRLPKGQFADVLNAYIAGYEAAKRDA
jgi:hypothetical protein